MKRVKVFYRRNLGMSPGKLAAQSVHAALGLYQKDPQDHWSCVVLAMSDRKFDSAKDLHPEGYVVVDAGLTELTPSTETCLAFYEEEIP
jgi:peptidyl-tRNA hydrolase